MKFYSYCFLTWKYILIIAVFCSSWQLNIDPNNSSIDLRSLQASPIDKDRLTKDFFGALQDGEIELVKKALSQSQESQPKSAKDYFHRGAICFQQGEEDLALADFNKAIEIDTENAIAYNNRGNIYFHQEKYNLSLAEFGQAIKTNPKNAKAYANRGIVYYEQRKDDLARADWENAQKLFQAQGNIASVKEIDGLLRSLLTIKFSN